MKNENRLWILFARKLAGEATADEIRELEQLLNERPDLLHSAEVITNWWKVNELSEKTHIDDAAQVKRIFHRIKRENQQSFDETLRKKGKETSLFNFLKENLMIQNYFKIAWRNLVRNKAFSLVNITGLAIGMAGATLILLWIAHQFSFDKFHEKKDRIYQVYNLAEIEGEKRSWSGSSSLLGPVIQTIYPQAEEVFRINWVANLIFTTGEKHLESYGYFTDPGFLKSLDFPLIGGDKNTALDKPESVILTESFSRRLFDNEDPIGKTIRIDSNANFMVTGVMKDQPGNTTFDFEYLIPMEYRKKINWDIPKWDDYGVETFVLLKPGVTEQDANRLFHNIIKTHAPEMKNELFVHPMNKWHLYSRFENGKIAGGLIEQVRLFGIIGGFILLIACINYMNLSTAKSEKRAREVGIRKVIGAGKSSLVWQFISESVVIAFVAGIIALILAELSIGFFNQLVYADLVIPYSNPYFWIYGIVFILISGIIAGSYPALYLAANKPITALRSKLKAVRALVTPRKVLVVFQFSFAIVFIICTIIIYRQIKFGQSRDAGYTRENLAYVYLRGDIPKHYQQVRSELYNSGAIESVTRTNSPISYMWTSDASFEWPGKDPNLKTSFATYHSDNDFAKTMGIDIIAGRDINSLNYPTDTMALLLNESAVKTMGLNNPVGQFVKSSQGNWQIVGLLKDFAPGSPYHPV
ncbi:MAG TPA: ABC transporter permease, partial [Chitinophagaceae bacterium]|nr:ABC transporter permease [Chitinophagaceae bacterium]